MVSGKIGGLACGTHNALAIQSLQETPDAIARHHRGHLWHDRDAGARTVVLPGLWVPDTVNGRFDLLLLHLWLFLRRLKSVEGGAALSQGLFDHFCNDMDDNLREMGVSDLKVPKRMQAFGEAFYGRTAAYDMALTEGREALAQAMCKNILNGENIEKARLLAAYAEAAMAALDGQDEATLASGSARFPCRRMARSNEQDWYDREARPVARPRCGGADTGDGPASRPIRPSATRWPMSGACRCFRCRPRST